MKTVDFSETIAASDRKASRRRNLIEYMKICDYCISLDEKELLELESGNGSWYCTNCKADCDLCSGSVLYGHKAVQCDKCEMWIHNKCSLITESEFDSVENTNCTWICPKCDFF